MTLPSTCSFSNMDQVGAGRREGRWGGEEGQDHAANVLGQGWALKFLAADAESIIHSCFIALLSLAELVCGVRCAGEYYRLHHDWIPEQLQVRVRGVRGGFKSMYARGAGTGDVCRE